MEAPAADDDDRISAELFAADANEDDDVEMVVEAIEPMLATNSSPVSRLANAASLYPSARNGGGSGATDSSCCSDLLSVSSSSDLASSLLLV